MAPPKTEAADKPNSIDGLIRAANQAARNRDYSTCAQTLEQLVATDGVPVTIEPGTYTVELSTHLVTDVILNGERKTQLAGRCVGTLQVVDEGFASIHGVFDGNTCVVEATRGSLAP